jgi:hypothetical protein
MIPATESAACKALIAQLPTMATWCVECWMGRVCVILDAWQGEPEPEPPPRFGCPSCEVVLGPCVDSAGIYVGALRHPAHSFWEWAPDPMREAIARAGIGGGPSCPSACTCFYDGSVWLGDLAVVLRTELDASRLGATWTSFLDESSVKMREALIGMFERSVRSGYARCSPLVPGPRVLPAQLGAVRVDPQLVHLVRAIFGVHVDWLARGPEDPVLVFDADRPLAALGPLREKQA